MDIESLTTLIDDLHSDDPARRLPAERTLDQESAFLEAAERERVEGAANAGRRRRPASEPPRLTPDETVAAWRARAVADNAVFAAHRAKQDEVEATERQAKADRIAADAVAATAMATRAEEGRNAAARNADRLVEVRRLVAGCNPEALRLGLRIAITCRNAADAAHSSAQADVARARAAVVEARADLDSYSDIGEWQDRDAVEALRDGTLGEPDTVLVTVLADRDAAAGRLTVAERAERVLTAALASRHAAALNAAEMVECHASALLVVEVEAFAVALERAEAQAATLRAGLMSLDGLWLTAPGVTAPMPVTLTDRQRRLLTNPPANTLAGRDAATAAALRSHYAALLLDADAPLAGAVP